MTDPWIAVITALEPEYQKFKQMSESVPTVSCTVFKKNFRNWIRIHEDWDETPAEEHHQYNTVDHSAVEEKINWTIEQLASWAFVSRQSYDQWAFIRKRDAEKFKTLFTLKWAQ
jgi:hypothetical protein